MKVISIQQPFATLIAEGYKEFEFRTWRTHYRGELLIHASKSIDKVAMKKFEALHLDYPTGCIIAKVWLTDCIVIDEKAREMLKKKNPLVYSGVIQHPEWKGYGFRLERVKKIEPILINGRLGLWDYN